MQEKVFIRDKSRFEKKLHSVKQLGPSGLHVVTDFDRTLTRASINGRTHSTFSLLWDYLSPESYERAQKLFGKYYPIERSLTIPQLEKEQSMIEWWQHAIDNLVASGLTREMLEDVISSDKLVLRDGAEDFFASLEQNQIPLLILSSGIGDIINYSVQLRKDTNQGIHVLSNFFDYDELGKVSGYSSDVIHSFSKRQKLFQDDRYWGQVENRENVLILGDTLGDADMVDNDDYDTVLRIGYLNENIEQQKDPFSEAFDVLILGDVGMDYINGLMGEIGC